MRGHADHFNLIPVRAATQQSVQRRLKQPLGDDRIPARDYDGKAHPGGDKSPSIAIGLPRSGSVQAQKLKANPSSGSTVKMRDFHGFR